MTADRQRVAIVTGGGAGIGAAVAEELGRQGAFVITIDPLVTVDGSAQAPSAEETTAGRIVAAGGAARATSVSVTDASAVHRVFNEAVEEFGGVDAVVNVAGITRPTSFTRGNDEDWRGVLSVHLDGYRNVLLAALSVMAPAGHGHILGVTSGSGWRAADTGAYGCAKRAVASLTWQLGRQAPPGVVINAMSPIAMTRMVTNALKGQAAAAAPRPAGSAPASSGASSSTGGLSLGSMPAPEELGPFAAHLVSDDFTACRGQVLFTAGSEVAVIDQPRFLEVFGDQGGASLAHTLDRLVPGAFVPAETKQQSGGGSNARFASASDDAADDVTAAPPAVQTCIVVAEVDAVADATVAALEARGVTCHRLAADAVSGFGGSADVLAAAVGTGDPVDAVVLALAGGPSDDAPSGWERTLAEHADVAEQIYTDAAWARSVADLSARTERSIRLVTLTDAATAGGRSRAQASAQLARAARRATNDLVAALAVSVETGAPAAAAELAAHLICSPGAAPLSGAELAVQTGSIGLRSHPRVRASLVLGGATIPSWFDDALRESSGER